MSAANYVSDGRQRLLRTLKLLAGNEVDGITPSELARANGCSQSNVTIDLANLREAGLAEQIATTGRWRLGPALVQIALAHLAAMDKAERRLAETKQRYSRHD